MIELNTSPFFLKDDDIKWVNDTMSAMSDEDKLHQLFFLVAYSDDQEYLSYLTRELKTGGVMCRNMGKREIVSVNNRIQKLSNVPMFIAANLETGGNGAIVEGTRIGSEMQVAATGDVGFAKKLATVCAEQGLAAGINYNFAPIVDIDYNFRNPITNTRTFGSDVETIINFSREYIETMQSYGMATASKHFPGDGVDERDQHLVTNVNTMACDDWDETYGKVYSECIDADALTIMNGHIMLPEYSRRLNPYLKDSEILPSSLSKELINGLLREKLGFNGMIITDATPMSGFTICMSREEAVPYSIECGNDMFLFTKNLEEDIIYMKRGFEKGILSRKRLDEAVTRILATKAAIGLHRMQRDGTIYPTVEKLEKALANPQFLQWSEECAEKAITLVKEEPEILPLDAEKYSRVLLYGLEPNGESALGYGSRDDVSKKAKALLTQEGFEVDIWAPSSGYEGLMVSEKEMTDKYDIIIYIANIATKSNQTVVRIEWAQPMGSNVPNLMHGIPTIFVSLENPYHLLDAPRVKTYINTYGSSDVVLEKLIDKLMGRSKFTGVSPVDPFCGKWDATL